jgi:hypothetical protein
MSVGTQLRGAQAASLLFAAVCREHTCDVPNELRTPLFHDAPPNASGKLPDAAGWQPALPRLTAAAHLL